ncbi:EF-hand domain-containing protein [Xanthomonas sp. AmX2]|uniref:EF-hand domain-containing protein n=1 Tax=Xanthomonas sp. TaxID=29446 RepID=UPI00197DFBBC|nr:EF-hand domain-containing protein [Xanthomonas sp.]MBN6150538.1 EF-hand domain-containing protein [Xanthomonas sp.]
MSPAQSAPGRGRRLPRRASWALLALAATGFGAAAQVSSTADYLQRMDRDGDGRIGLDEYLAWMSYAFDERDSDRDGVLSAAELPGGRGQPLTRAQHQATLTARFRKQDADGNGYLSARELAAPPR